MYYEITKEQADLIGKINYAEGKRFDPYTCEQKNGNYLVAEDMYVLLKENSQMSKVDFTKQTKLEASAIDLK